MLDIEENREQFLVRSYELHLFSLFFIWQDSSGQDEIQAQSGQLPNFQ